MNRGNFSIDPDEEMKRNCCGTLGRGFDDFSRKDLRDIILDKNKVIADLEEHAYGSASWIENLNKGLKKANERKKNAPPKESDEEFRKRLEEFDKGSAPTENWGADELNGGMNAEETRKKLEESKKRIEEGKKRAEELAKQEAEADRQIERQEQDMKLSRLQGEDAGLSYQRQALDRERQLAKIDLEKRIGHIQERAQTPPKGRGGGVVVSKEPSREPPREPPKEPPIVRADGSNAAEITAGALTPEQKIIIQTALEYANEQALRATGWQDTMYPAELNRWVAVFRQNVSPELRPVVDENMALIRQLANMRPDLRANYIESIVDEIGRSLNRAISSSGKKPDAVYKQIEKRKGGAAVPTPTEPKVSPVAAAAAALAPVRTAIQNGIGDAIYGKSDDPKKQKKGLLGISEEGKEESQKKVMKNIVVPVMKWAKQAGTDIEDAANRIFNPDKYDADMKERRIKQIKRTEAEAGIVRDKENPSIIVRKPAGLWKADTSDPNEVAYNTQRIASRKPEDVFYIRVPNPIFAAKLRPSFKELANAGFVKQGKIGNDKELDLWTGVNQYNKNEDIDGTLKSLHDDPFIFIPENRAKEIYGKLRQVVVGKEDEAIVEGYDVDGQRWTKGDLKAFAAIDPKTLKGQELLEWKRGKLQIDTAGTRIALEKVNKDIAELERRAEGYMVINNLPVKRKDAVSYQASDQAEMAKLREAKKTLEKRTIDIQKGKERFVAEDRAFNNAAAAKREKDYRDNLERMGRESMEQQNKDTAEWEAKPVAEKIAILEEALADPQNNQMEIADYTEQIEQLRTEEASEKVEEQAQGSVDLLQQAEVIGAEGGAKPCWKGYEMIGMKQKGKRTVPNCVPIGDGMWEDEAEMEGAGAMEYILQKAGMPIFNPSGDTTKAGRQSFTPDYDAYGDDEEQGRLNAFNLSASMYDQSKAIELPDFKLLKDDTSLRFYRKDDEDVILVGVRGTDFKSWTDFYTWFVIGGRGDLRMTGRFQDDLAKMIAFQRNYPPSQFYYVATGHSLAGSIIDRFLEMGLIEEAITYNPSIERKHMLDENILNHRVYLDTDPLFILMGQYSPNTEIRVNPNKTNFYNPSKEKDYLIKSHLIYPVSNPALEGGGMEGSGKTYTLEEWKAIFDAKLEQKRQQIEAREAKKKQTAKAKRERAKAVRDGRDEPPPLETPAVFRTSRVQKATPPKQREPEPEEEYPEVEVTEYEMGDEIYLVEDAREGLAFADRRVFDNDNEEIGNLTVDDVGKTLVKMVMAREKPKAKKPRFKIVAPASARVELREELVAEQPRTEEGQFEVAVAQPRPITALPRMTMKQKEFFMNLLSRNVSATQKSILLARSGMSDKLVERLLPFMTSSNKREVMKQTGMITEKVAEKRTDTDYTHLTADIKKGLRKLAQDIMNMKGRRPTMLDDARRTDTLKKMTETEKRQMLRRNFIAGVKSCEAIASMTRTDMFGDYSCRKWDATEPSFFKRVETSEYGVKGRCMAIGDEANIPQGATLDQLKPVVGVGRDNAVLSSRMLAELSPSTWGVEDKPDAKFLSKGVPVTKSTPDVDLAEHIRETQKVWRMCILRMFLSCGIEASITKKINQSWKRGYGILIEWTKLEGDGKLSKAKVAVAQKETDEKLSSPKLRDFLVDLRGFCAMVADETEAEDEATGAQRRKDEEEKIYMKRLESEISPDEEEERAKVLANPELKERLWKAIQQDTRRLNLAFDTAPFSGNLRQKINRMKRIAGIDYNIGYGSVVPANFWVSGLKAKLPPIRKKEGYYPSVEQYIKDMEK